MEKGSVGIGPGSLISVFDRRKTSRFDQLGQFDTALVKAGNDRRYGRSHVEPT